MRILGVLAVVFVLLGCEANVEKIAKQDNLRGPAKENLSKCELEKDFRACALLANAYQNGRMANQSNEKALYYTKKSCELRNEAFEKLAMSNPNDKNLRKKFSMNPCEVVFSQNAMAGYSNISEALKSEKGTEWVKFLEQSCLNDEFTNTACFWVADFALYKSEWEKAKDFALRSCLKGELQDVGGCEFYYENYVLKKNPRFFKDEERSFWFRGLGK